MFEATGDRPRWCPIYDLLVTVEPGQVLTYEELSETAGKDIRQCRHRLYAAQKALERNDKRTLECVPRKGYRVVFAGEHERLAGQHRRRARKQIGRARRRVSSADRTQLAQDQRERLDVMASTLAWHENLLSRNAARIEEVDEARKETQRENKADVAALSARVEQLAARLDHSGTSTSCDAG